MEWTNYKKILLLLTMVSQSSVGVALSLAHLATYSWLPLEARQGDFFKCFCIMGFTTNWLVLLLSLHWVTVMAIFSSFALSLHLNEATTQLKT